MKNIIKYKGKEYDFKFRFRAVEFLQKEWGLKSLSDVYTKLSGLMQEMTATNMVVIFRAGFSHHKGITTQLVEKILEDGDKNMIELMNLIVASITADTPEQKESDEKN